MNRKASLDLAVLVDDEWMDRLSQKLYFLRKDQEDALRWAPDHPH